MQGRFLQFSVTQKLRYYVVKVTTSNNFGTENVIYYIFLSFIPSKGTNIILGILYKKKTRKASTVHRKLKKIVIRPVIDEN